MCTYYMTSTNEYERSCIYLYYRIVNVNLRVPIHASFVIVNCHLIIYYPCQIGHVMNETLEI